MNTVQFASPGVRHGDGVVLIQPDLPEELHGSHLGQGWVYVAVTDADAHYERARPAPMFSVRRTRPLRVVSVATALATPKDLCGVSVPIVQQPTVASRMVQGRQPATISTSFTACRDPAHDGRHAGHVGTKANL
jgi:non-ribosomal peptide synthetase component F